MPHTEHDKNPIRIEVGRRSSGSYRFGVDRLEVNFIVWLRLININRTMSPPSSNQRLDADVDTTFPFNNNSSP